MSVQKPWRIVDNGTASGTVSDSTVRYLNGGTSGRPFVNHLYKGCVIIVNRTAETGTCTLAVKLQGYYRDGDTYYDVANADVVTFANGDTGLRYAMVYPGATGSDADAVIAVDTNYNLVNGFLPHEFAISVTHGGTSVTNTFGISVQPLT